jgi:tRNA threonylcarbamoyladenosine biosynthesis protein TsaE
MPVITAGSARDMQLVGQKIGRKLRAGQIISLEGQLGAGKTTLMQGIAKSLGVTKALTSPTFILYRVIPIGAVQEKKTGARWLVHGDAYRVTRAQEFLEAGLADAAQDPQTITIIEWGDRIREILPRRVLRIKINTQTKRRGSDEARHVHVPTALAP